MTATTTTTAAMPGGRAPLTPAKARHFDALGALTDEIIAEHGEEFAIGALLITARAVAERQAAARAAAPATP